MQQLTELTTTPLGGTGLEITRVGFGAWAIGGSGWKGGWDHRKTSSRSRRSTGRWSSG
jgi:aryl-alcohol dehydrogenase-like predicted oxidoreductase